MRDFEELQTSVMEPLTGSRRELSDTVAERQERERNSQIVRWYVLVLPISGKGTYRGNPAAALQGELDRRIRNGEPRFEYFAPTYTEAKETKSGFVDTKRPLLFNYVFVRASENEIYRMKQHLTQYNFLPRIRDGKSEYYPYLTDEAMENLRWVARSYSNVLPLYAPEPERLMKGDRVRITEGKFKGVEASVIIQPGAGRKDVVVCVEGCMYVPLLSVEPGQYEVIALNSENRHVYTRLNGDRLPNGLHEALRRHHSAEGVTEADRRLAAETLSHYGSLTMESDVMRCKLYAILLPAYAILGDRERYEALMGTIRSILPLVRAEQSLALLLVTLYGCTDNSIYRNQAHAIVDAWLTEKSPKKSKQQLIRRLADYDEWFGHRP